MENKYILAIDPGNVLSAYVVLDNKLKPVDFGKVDNYELKENMLDIINRYRIRNVAIEYIACYGLAVGKEVFDTCIWIGKFTEKICSHIDIDEITPIYRKDEKINLCNSMKAKDTNIRRALIDRFAQHDFKNGKGTKYKKDWFYGFKADVWASYAVAITYYDMYLSKKAI